MKIDRRRKSRFCIADSCTNAPSSGSIDEVDPGFEFDQSVPENDCP